MATLCSRARRLLLGFDLRFEDATMETAYKKDQEMDILRFMRVASSTYVVGVLCLLLSQIRKETYYGRSGNEFAWEVSDPRTTTFALWFLCLVVSGMYTIFACLRIKYGYFKAVNVEWASLMILIGATLAAHIVNFWTLPRFFGLEPSDVWTFSVERSRLNYVLVLDGVLTCACHLAPIRTCVLWLLPAFVFVPYVVLEEVVAPGSPDAQEGANVLGLFNILGIFLLALFAYVGAWRHEKFVRQKFLDLHCADARLKQSEERLVTERVRRMKADRRVLGSMCDAIVSLDCEHKLAQPCPKLSGLLLKRSPLSQGTSFVDLLTDDGERERFVEFLRSESEHLADAQPPSLANEDVEDGDDIGHVYHSHLRDVNGVRVAVHMHCCCYVDDDGQVRYTIGVVEAGNNERLPVAPDAMDAHHAAMGLHLTKTALRDPAGSVGGTSLYTVLEGDRSINEAGEMFVQFDACSSRMQIINASPSFMQLMGPFREKKELKPLLAQRHRKRFEEWILEHVHDRIFGDSSGGDVRIEYGKICLQRPSDENARVERRFVCRLAEDPACMQNEANGKECFPVVLMLTALETVRHKSDHTKRSLEKALKLGHSSKESEKKRVGSSPIIGKTQLGSEPYQQL
eukprot:TRINITY_DN9246_c0_g4_i1.p1 TRINITY_DN9246_c0_g4~~TRINITY_DN9246_c0_g4_i1.p1  ORF type:complete len:649 (-),score=77.90 TRINITY_DN9246_c0_g4_i1:359-2242(-)